MDYSGYTRSSNVEDERPGKIGEWLNYLSAPIQNAAFQLRTHPFEKSFNHYEQLYLKNNPPLDPSQFNPLAIQAGIQDVGALPPFRSQPPFLSGAYPDYYKTPLHQTFSNESQWAGPNTPSWINDSQLAAPNGRIMFDERKPTTFGLPNPLQMIGFR